MSFSAFLVTAARSGEGKTSVSLALAAALCKEGYRVQSFKCGPDYIDPTFLQSVTQRKCINLDTWLQGRTGVQESFARNCQDADLALIEGVMGLCDGKEEDGTGSSLDCAMSLQIPVLLVVNARGMAQSIVPFVEGFTHYLEQRGLSLAAVIATKVGSPRHHELLATALAQAKLPPLLGSLPLSEKFALPSRQLGLVPQAELPTTAVFTHLAEAGKSFTLHELLARTQVPRHSLRTILATSKPPRRRLALAQDEAFCFYYEENLNWLTAEGWEIIPFSPTHDTKLPQTDAIYLGGGYPEVFAEQLAKNESMRREIREAVWQGVELFAECGGFMYLAEQLISIEKKAYPMCGILQARAVMGEKMQSLGYREAEFLEKTPFGLHTKILRGHEFHWSRMEFFHDYQPLCSYRNRKGEQIKTGIIAGPQQNVLASYLHFYWGQAEHSFTKGQ